MSEKRFVIDEEGISDNKTDNWYCWKEEVVDLLNELHEENKELKTHNLQHFLEWLVIKGYVTDELMKDINNVIDCVDKFKEHLTDEQFEKELLDNGK